MTKTECYNQVLAFSGEEPISDLETPDYTANLVGSHFEVTKRRVLAMGHSFNTDVLTLTPDNNSELLVPTGTIKVRFGSGKDNLIVRGGKVWNNQTASLHDQTERVLVTLDLAWEQIPEAFQQWISLEIAAEFRVRLNGLDNTVIYIKQQAAKAKAVALNSEPANTKGATGWGAIQSAYGA